MSAPEAELPTTITFFEVKSWGRRKYFEWVIVLGYVLFHSEIPGMDGM